MKKTTARVIITFDCNRKCKYCCNKYKKIISKARKIKNVDCLAKYKEICITGGEPLLDPDRTLDIIEAIKDVNPFAKMYLYTTLYTPDLSDVVFIIDGIHYTIHENATRNDIMNFYKFQAGASKFIEKSFRLYIHKNVKYGITIYPDVWKRIEVKPWISEKDCRLPKHEQLYILK